MSVFVCGDIHGDYDISKLNTSYWPEQKSLTKDDYLIILGDFGMIWSFMEDKTEKYLLRQLSSRRFTTLFVDGNHENHDRLDKLPVIERFGGKLGVVRDDIFHIKRGEILTIDGMKLFCFGGAMSTDKIYRKEFVSWWRQEEPNIDEMEYGIKNLEKHDWTVDHVLTHAAPSSIVNEIGYEERVADSTARYFEMLKDDIEFKSWHFGHYHQDMTIQERFRCHYRMEPFKLVK